MERFLRWLSHRSFQTLFALSDFVYGILYHLVGYRKEVVRKNLGHAFPEKSKEELRDLEKKFYHSFCDTIFEAIKFYTVSPEEISSRIQIENQELVRKYREEKRPFFILLGHYGCWEWGSAYSLITQGTDIFMVYKKLTNATFDDIMLHLRSRFNSTMVEDKHLLRFLVGEKKKNHSLEVGFAMDQSPEPHSLNYWTHFMNQETAVIDTAERLARKLGYGMVYYDVEKLGRGKYKATIVPMSENVADTQPYEMTEMYIRLMEKTILRAPEHYLWSHNRWKYSNSHEKN